MSMTREDHARADVERIFTEHPLLREAAKNNVEIYAWFKQAQRGACTVEEALVGALVRLADDNLKQFNEIVKIKYKQEYPNAST